MRFRFLFRGKWNFVLEEKYILELIGMVRGLCHSFDIISCHNEYLAHDQHETLYSFNKPNDTTHERPPLQRYFIRNLRVSRNRHFSSHSTIQWTTTHSNFLRFILSPIFHPFKHEFIAIILNGAICVISEWIFK